MESALNERKGLKGVPGQVHSRKQNFPPVVQGRELTQGTTFRGPIKDVTSPSLYQQGEEIVLPEPEKAWSHGGGNGDR